MHIHGIILSEADLQGYPDGLSIKNADISHLVGGMVYYGKELMGVVQAAKAIQGPQDCASDSDRGLLDLGQGKPLVRATVFLRDDKAGWAELVRDRAVCWSATGVVLAKSDDHGTHTALSAVMLGPLGIAPSVYRVFPGKG